VKKVLIIGKTPPPVGGITVHVGRLIEGLYENGFQQFSFCDLQNEPVLSIISKIVRHRVAHLHVSNPFIQLCAAVFYRIFFKKLILTYHGNWGRYGSSGDWAVNLSAWMCAIPIVQNQESFRRALYWNKRARLITTFISSRYIAPVNVQHAAQLTDFRKRYKSIFCTNAWNLTFDKNGNETYGIAQIILNMLYVSNAGLIISDPSGSYKPFLTSIFGVIPDHFLFVHEPHDFRNVLRVADAFIRNTTTDGVSLSIFEAHELNVVVLASDSVDRPGFCNIFHDITKTDLIKELKKGRERLESEGNALLTDAMKELTVLYKQCL
jgi:hypothetical protein